MFKKLGSVFAFCVLAAPSIAHAGLINGDFSTGDLSGWTVFTTTNGTNGISLPTVTTFETVSGTSSNAAEFEVGQLFFGGGAAGGGIQQFVTILGSSITLSVDVAAYQAAAFTNSDGGIFNLLLDGVSIANWSSGSITAGSTLRNTLSATTPVISGGHTIGLSITRVYLSAVQTPLQFADNFTLLDSGAGSPVPEPSSLALIALGLPALALLRRSK